MNTKKAIESLAGVLLLITVISCQEPDQNFASLEELSDEARNFLAVQSSSKSAISAMGRTGGGPNQMINRSYGALMDGSTGLQGGVLEGSDSTLIDDPSWGWTSCATVTNTQNPDGSYTYVTDYGDGCFEGWGDYKYFMHGKYSSTNKYTESRNGSVMKFDYFSRNRFDNYGGTYYWQNDTSSWLSNGRSTYTGFSSYDTLRQTFTGNYSWTDTSDYSYGKETYASRSMGNSRYSEKESVILSSIYEYSYGQETYRTTVLEPLVMDYSCNNSMVSDDYLMSRVYMTYVSGRERIDYVRDGVSGMFEIDYGNGECDNIIYIYENGKVFKVDRNLDFGAIRPERG